MCTTYKNTLMAGASKVDITPPLPATLCGGFKQYRTEKVLDM